MTVQIRQLNDRMYRFCNAGNRWCFYFLSSLIKYFLVKTNAACLYFLDVAYFLPNSASCFAIDMFLIKRKCLVKVPKIQGIMDMYVMHCNLPRLY